MSNVENIDLVVASMAATGCFYTNDYVISIAELTQLPKSWKNKKTYVAPTVSDILKICSSVDIDIANSCRMVYIGDSNTHLLLDSITCASNNHVLRVESLTNSISINFSVLGSFLNSVQKIWIRTSIAEVFIYAYNGNYYTDKVYASRFNQLVENFTYFPNGTMWSVSEIHLRYSLLFAKMLTLKENLTVDDVQHGLPITELSIANGTSIRMKSGNEELVLSFSDAEQISYFDFIILKTQTDDILTGVNSKNLAYRKFAAMLNLYNRVEPISTVTLHNVPVKKYTVNGNDIMLCKIDTTKSLLSLFVKNGAVIACFISSSDVNRCYCEEMTADLLDRAF